MATGVRLRIILVLAVLASACGAADEPVEPGDLALRDLLGVAPAVAASWSDGQRAAAREVLADGLREEPDVTVAVATDEVATIRALALADDRLLDDDRDALGLVVDGRAIEAPVATAALRGEPAAAPPVVVELDARAWPCAGATPCDLGVLSALAADAAPGAARVRVLPVAQLTVIAVRTTAADGTPTLLVNPIVTAVAGTVAAVEAPAASAVPPIASVRSTPAPVIPLPLVMGTWSYGDTIDSCVGGVQQDCSSCATGGTCEPIWSDMTGMQACAILDNDRGRNYALLCANLAVSLSNIASCIADRAPQCAIDGNAINSSSTLDANAVFLDDPACADAVHVCLGTLFATDDGGGCGACDGCDCGSCGNDNDNGNCGSSSTDDQSCGLDGCGDNGGCNGCNNNGSGGGCSNSGGGGNGGCTIAASPPGHSVGLAAGLLWAFLPVPAALLARRRARRRRDAAPADPA